MSRQKSKNSWPSKTVLNRNRNHLERELRRKLIQYEHRYELKSENLESELESGRIKDTAEICDWAIAYDTLKRIRNA